MPLLVQICILVATIAFIAVTVVLIRAIAQLRSTAAQLERTMAHLDTTIPEIERTVVEARGVLDTLGTAAARIDGLTKDFVTTGSKLARASSLMVNEVVEPAVQIAALVKGVRAGAATLAGTFFKKRGADPASSHKGGNHHE